MDLISILTDLVKDFMAAVPGIVGAIFVVILGWIIAKIVASVIKKLLKKIGIDDLADKLNDIEIVSKANLNIVPSILLSKIAYYIILLIFWIAATDILGMEAVSVLMKDLIAYIPYVISALIVLVIGVFIAEFIKNIVLTTCQSLGIPSAKLIAGFVFWFIFLTAIVSALTQAGINTDFVTSNLSIIIGGGVLAFALGYGFASKDMMANFLASFYSKDKFKLGDKISVDGATGTIVDMDNASLVIQGDGKKTIVPLSKLTSEKVELFDV